VWTASTIQEAAARHAEQAADVVVADGDLREDLPLEFGDRTIDGNQGCRIIILAADVSTIRLQRALAANVSGYVLKGDPAETILAAIREAAAGRHAWSPAV